jgi:molybdopterin-guanine dinucleotide biosynthesis protein A
VSAALLGVILAGGQSRRYGMSKALATIGGERLVDRVRRALVTAVPEVIVSANDPELGRAIGLPWYPDELPDAGGLGGIHATLGIAAARGASAILAVACDMPFLSPALLARLADASEADVVIPESDGRRGVEPLCARYGVACRGPIEAAIARGDRRMIAFHDEVHVQRIPIAEVRALGDPALLFLNVNTPDDAALAERVIASGAAP